MINSMKTISIRQPWASLVVAGIKTVENRSRPTRYRGRVLIHAARTIDTDGLAIVNEVMADYGGPIPRGEWPASALIGSVTIIDCVTASEDEFFTGPFGYILTDALEFPTPVPARGQLGLYDTPYITVALAAQILGKSETTIRAQLRQKGIGQKVGRDYMISDSDFTALESVPPPGRPKTERNQ